MACRIEKKPLLLIDFADAIQDDLFKIAELFSLFKTHIKLKVRNEDGNPNDVQVPNIDPSWFI